jgi:hypothetical protein
MLRWSVWDVVHQFMKKHTQMQWSKEILESQPLDIFENEQLSETSGLWNIENINISPHDAGGLPQGAGNTATTMPQKESRALGTCMGNKQTDMGRKKTIQSMTMYTILPFNTNTHSRRGRPKCKRNKKSTLL